MKQYTSSRLVIHIPSRNYLLRAFLNYICLQYVTQVTLSVTIDAMSVGSTKYNYEAASSHSAKLAWNVVESSEEGTEQASYASSERIWYKKKNEYLFITIT